MAETQHQQGQGKGETQGASRPAVAGTAQTSGLAEVQQILATDEAGALSVAGIIRAHLDERDAIIAWLHQHRGNQFVQQVTQQLGTIERALPPGVELKSVRASVTIPGKKKIAGDWKSSVATREATQLTVEVSTTGIKAWLSPELFVDATWPLQNAELRGAGVSFADGKPYADVVDGHGLGSGMFSIKDKLGGKVTDAIAHGIAGTPFARPGYKPTQDADLGGTLDKVVHGFGALFNDHEDPGHEHDHKDKKPALSGKDLQHVSAGATITAKAGGVFGKAGTGLVIAPGSDVSLTVDGDGNADAMSHAKSPAEAVQAAHIRGLTITATGMEVHAKGKPVARIGSLTMAPGGEIKIGELELLGKARDAQVMESGLSLLFGLMALEGRDGNTANGALRNAQDPVIVDGVTRSMMEKEFTETVRKLILQYRNVVPGMDLAKSLGIGG